MEDHVKRWSLPGGGERVAKEYWKQLSVSSDPLDWEIYTTARQIFMARLQQYCMASTTRNTESWRGECSTGSFRWVFVGPPTYDNDSFIFAPAER